MNVCPLIFLNTINSENVRVHSLQNHKPEYMSVESPQIGLQLTQVEYSNEECNRNCTEEIIGSYLHFLTWGLSQSKCSIHFCRIESACPLLEMHLTYCILAYSSSRQRESDYP